MRRIYRIIAILVLPALFVNGCQRSDPDSDVPTPVSTTSASLVAGDLVPRALHKVSVPQSERSGVLSGSDPTPTSNPAQFALEPHRVVSKNLVRLIPAGSPPEIRILPIDSPEQARVVVSVAVAPERGQRVLKGIHLRSFSDGAILDKSRDLAEDDEVIRTGLGGQPNLADRAGLGDEMRDLLRHEPGFALLAMPARPLSIDQPFKPGKVLIELPPEAALAGALVFVDQPSSTIELGAVAGSIHHSTGEQAKIVADLSDAGTPIEGASVIAWLEKPGNRRDPDSTLPLRGIGGGKHVVEVPLTSTSATDIGLWTVHLIARGTTPDGREYERTSEVSFSYSVPHARMTTVYTPVVVRGSDRLVDEVVFDVEVESIVVDRLGLRGTLVVNDNGVERSIATAQVGFDASEGQSRVSLRFGSGAMFLAHQDGPYHLRDLVLVSHGNATVQHRLGRGLDLRTPRIPAKALRPVETLSPAIEESLNLGTL
ncbi:MAG: hypothetical protein HY698_14380 [Deltaproteobacteria bacterium]|nr:hypothetical protein [Deltaproteobacteria bacterium]